MDVRSVFISDVHLGTRACQAGHLIDFLREYPSQYLFLLGDIVDFWAMSQGSIYWTQEHNTVVQKILRRARQGCEVIYVPGNHDEPLREFSGSAFGGIRLENRYVHRTADGRRILLIHGDEFDQVTRYHRWVALLGDRAYDFLIAMNLRLSHVRRTLRRPGYWSLARYAKKKVRTAANFIFDFEDSVVHHVLDEGYDGVICGHIHWARLKEINGVQYVNNGDWVDSCSAVVEHHDGRLELVEWAGTTEVPLTQDGDSEQDPAAPPIADGLISTG